LLLIIKVNSVNFTEMIRIIFKKINEYHKLGERWTFGLKPEIWEVVKVYQLLGFGSIVWKCSKINAESVTESANSLEPNLGPGQSRGLRASQITE